MFGSALVAREEPKLIIFAGFLCSLIFFFATIALGNLKRSEEVGWLELIAALGFALGTAASVHRICVTTALLFSGGFFVYLNFYSTRIRSRLDQSSTTKGRGK